MERLDKKAVVITIEDDPEHEGRIIVKATPDCVNMAAMIKLGTASPAFGCALFLMRTIWEKNKKSRGKIWTPERFS